VRGQIEQEAPQWDVRHVDDQHIPTKETCDIKLISTHELRPLLPEDGAFERLLADDDGREISDLTGLHREPAGIDALLLETPPDQRSSLVVANRRRNTDLRPEPRQRDGSVRGRPARRRNLFPHFGLLPHRGVLRHRDQPVPGREPDAGDSRRSVEGHG
jgi:hypothetical protein